MRKMLGLAIPLLLMGGALPAHAALVEYDFVGHVVANDGGPLAGVLNPAPTTSGNVVSGYLRYDTTIAATTPGVFNLTDAVFHVQYPGIALDATGVTATIGVNRDVIVFKASFPASEFAPVSVTSNSIALGFQTSTNDFFSLTALPTSVPPNDHTLGFSYVSGGVPHGASTDTDLIVTSALTSVPEPTSLAVFASGLGLFALLRNRSTARSARQPA